MARLHFRATHGPCEGFSRIHVSSRIHDASTQSKQLPNDVFLADGQTRSRLKGEKDCTRRQRASLHSAPYHEYRAYDIHPFDHPSKTLFEYLDVTSPDVIALSLLSLCSAIFCLQNFRRH